MKSDFRFESLKGKFCSNPLDHNLMIGCPKRNRGDYSKRLLNKGLKKPRLKFNSGLELIRLGTTRPSAQFDDACTLFLFTVFYILTEMLSQKFLLFILFSQVRKMLREYARLETF